jgi:MFS family permease
LPLPLMGGSVVPYAMAAGGCALGAMLGLTVHMPLYYEAVYHLSASESGLALIPLAAVSTGGAAIAGKAMARMKHYKRVAIIGTAFFASIAGVLTAATPLPLWALLALLSLFALGLGTTFPISVVSIQNSVHRSQVGTITGALNFFRALAASFTVAAFTAVLLMALGAGVSLGEGRSMVSGIAAADMVAAFRYVFAAAAAMMAGATLLMLLMAEKPLAGPATVPAEMAE